MCGVWVWAGFIVVHDSLVVRMHGLPLWRYSQYECRMALSLLRPYHCEENIVQLSDSSQNLNTPCLSTPFPR